MTLVQFYSAVAGGLLGGVVMLGISVLFWKLMFWWEGRK